MPRCSRRSTSSRTDDPYSGHQSWSKVLIENRGQALPDLGRGRHGSANDEKETRRLATPGFRGWTVYLTVPLFGGNAHLFDRLSADVTIQAVCPFDVLCEFPSFGISKGTEFSGVALGHRNRHLPVIETIIKASGISVQLAVQFEVLFFTHGFSSPIARQNRYLNRALLT